MFCHMSQNYQPYWCVFATKKTQKHTFEIHAEMDPLACQCNVPKMMGTRCDVAPLKFTVPKMMGTMWEACSPGIGEKSQLVDVANWPCFGESDQLVNDFGICLWVHTQMCDLMMNVTNVSLMGDMYVGFCPNVWILDICVHGQLPKCSMYMCKSASSTHMTFMHMWTLVCHGVGRGGPTYKQHAEFGLSLLPTHISIVSIVKLRLIYCTI